MMYRLSKHAQVERQDRLFAIIDTIGIGNEVDRFYRKETNAYEVFTDTGVVLILSEKDVLITAYAVRHEKAIAAYRNAGRRMVSPRVLNGIYYHEEHYKYLTKL